MDSVFLFLILLPDPVCGEWACVISYQQVQRVCREACILRTLIALLHCDGGMAAMTSLFTWSGAASDACTWGSYSGVAKCCGSSYRMTFLFCHCITAIKTHHQLVGLLWHTRILFKFWSLKLLKPKYWVGSVTSAGSRENGIFCLFQFKGCLHSSIA